MSLSNSLIYSQRENETAAYDTIRDELSELTRRAIETWLRDNDDRHLSELDRLCRGILRDSLIRFGRPYSWSEVKNLENIETAKTITAIAKHLTVIAKRLLNATVDAEQNIFVHHEPRKGLWLTLEPTTKEQPSTGLLRYCLAEERPRLTWLGRIFYGTTKSSKIFRTPGFWTMIVIVVPLIILALLLTIAAWCGYIHWSCGLLCSFLPPPAL